jgi:hypothetical protein
MSICKDTECNNKSVSKGYCDKHYRRFKKHGDSKSVHKHTYKICLDDECRENAISKGYCDKHYRRFKKTGTSKTVQKKQICKVDGCEGKHLAKSLCYTHYWMNAKKVTIDDKADMLIKNHNGACDICGTDKPRYPNRRLAIDHDHKTGIVRGMLCQKCNVGLGNFNDSPDLLNKAIKYLIK